MRRWWTIGLPLLAAACFSCSNKSNGGNGNGDGGDPVNPPGTDITVGDPVAIDDSNVIVSSISLAATPDASWAVAYYKDTQTTTQCTSHTPATPIGVTSIYYSKLEGTSWTKELVASSDVQNIITFTNTGISLVYKDSDPYIAYLGGTVSGQCCFGSDLMQASNTTGDWASLPLVNNSNDASSQICPFANDYCNFGDTVGLWPSQAVTPDGKTIGVVYQDIHNCFATDDTGRADVEIVLQGDTGSSTEWIDLCRGGGYYNRLVFDSAGVPAVTFFNGKDGSIYFSKRIANPWPWDDCTTSSCQTGYTCVTPYKRCVIKAVDNVAGMPENSLSLAIGQDGRYLLAYHNPTSRKLSFARSESAEGINWQSAIIDSDGATGMYPTILINQVTQKPVIVYYRCRADTNESSCDFNQDGVRLAVFVGEYPADLLTKTKWKKYNLDTELDKAATDGKFVSAAIQPDGTIGVAYLYTSVPPGQQALVFRSITVK